MAGEVRIRPFQSGDAAAFRDINLDWISRLFVVEPKDLEALERPEVSVLGKGGAILMAEIAGEAVGCIALLPFDKDVLELAKMGVRPSAQGKGAGRALVAAAVELARRMGAKRLYLETNSALGPALRLYEAAGFVPVAPPRPSPYSRADVFMELALA